MARTNVQTFSGDVEVTSNLEVGTANLFVDTQTGNVGIGTKLEVTHDGLAPLIYTILMVHMQVLSQQPM
jgi:hypothetical protein